MATTPECQGSLLRGAVYSSAESRKLVSSESDKLRPVMERAVVAYAHGCTHGGTVLARNHARVAAVTLRGGQHRTCWIVDCAPHCTADCTRSAVFSASPRPEFGGRDLSEV